MSVFELISCIELGIIFGITAIGIYQTFRVIDFPDLTCDGSFVVGIACTAMALKTDINPWMALVYAMLCGALAGLGTGILHIYFKISKLLSGIMMAFMLYSINLRIMRGMPNIALIDVPTIFSNSNSIIILLTLGIASALLISCILQTDFGLAMRSIGHNKRLATNCGVEINKITIINLMLSNALIALSGALFCQQQGFADISQGVGMIIVGQAAIMLSEKIFATRIMWQAIFACILGSILYRIIIAVALHSEWLGLETQDLNLITGVFLISIMLLPTMRVSKNNA